MAEAAERREGTRSGVLTEKVTTALLWLLIAAPPVLYILYSVHFAVNVPYWDDWLAIPLLRQWHDGFLNIGMLYGGDNGQRAFFARLLGLALAVSSGFNTKVTIIAGDGLLVIAYLLLLSILRRQGASMLAMAPVGLLFFSLSAYDVALWASNFSWSLETLCFIGALWCLQRMDSSEWYLAGSLAFAVIGAFSSFQGLLILVAGLLYVVLARFTLRRATIWVVMSLAVAAAYFAGLSVKYADPFLKKQPVPTAYFSHHLGAASQFFLLLLGNVFSGSDVVRGLPFSMLIALGSVLLVLAIAVLVRTLVRVDAEWYAVPAALVVYGLLAAAAIAVSRSWIGEKGALTPRYTLYTLLLLCGLYVAGIRPRSRARWVCASLIAVLLPLQVCATTDIGLRSGAEWHRAYLQDAVGTQHFASAPMSLLGQAVYWYPYQFKTVLAPEADGMHLSVFQYRVDLHPACLAQARGAAAQPDLTPNAAKALRAAYEMAREPFGPPHFGEDAFDRRVLDWATVATQNDSLGQCLLSYADEYQTAYADVAARLAPLQKPDSAMLPLPSAIARVVRDDSATRKAWQLLSFLYSVRGEAVYEFPGQIPGFQQNYLAWAARAPIADAWNPAWRVLAPYAGIYQRLEDALAKSASGASPRRIIAPRLDPQWNIPTDMRFFHAQGQSFLGLWGSGVPVNEYARSGRIAVRPGDTYAVSGTIDARFAAGPPPCFYLAEPSGFGIGMTCGDDGEKGRYTQIVRIPSDVPWVYWVAYTNNTTIVTDHLLVYADASLRKLSAAEASHQMFGPTPQSWWYLPAGFQFVHRGGHTTLAVYGTGAPIGNSYAHSGDANVIPGARYRLGVTIDGRYASGNPPCVYLAEQPSGRGIGMLCAQNGAVRRYAEAVRIPPGVRIIQAVAFTNNTDVASARRLSYTDLTLQRIK